MTICFLTAGDSIHSYRWIKYLADKGYRIYWVSFSPNKFGQIKNVKFYLLKDFSSKFLNIFLNALEVRKIIKEAKPDIVHCLYAGVNGALGALSGFHPFILTAFGSDIFEAPKSILKRIVIKFSLKKADLITCNGEPLKRRMTELGADSSKIRYVYWATDTKRFSPKKAKKSGFKVISIRNFEPVYDIETFVKAIPIVLKHVPKARFEIAGKGTEEQHLKEMVEMLKIEKSVKFLGWIKEDDVADYLNSSDVYVSTSLSDGDLAQSTQQAMSCEVPVITTDLEVNVKRVKNKSNGLIFPARDSKSLAKQIIFVFKNKKASEKMAENGRKTILKELDYFKNMKKVEEVYKEVI